MADILEEIVAYKRIEVARQKELEPARELIRKVERSMVDTPRQTLSMSNSLRAHEFGIIAEFKRKSPSKGWIKEEGRPENIPSSYSDNGAAAVSILTDEKYFGGHLDFVRTARPRVTVPILRKDFIVDEYQLFQAKDIEADAVLLIAAALEKERCKALASLAHELGFEVLLETHSESELDYIHEGIDMVGVNNRNLGTFHTDVQNSYTMASKLPKEFTLVSESGISDPRTIVELKEAGFSGFLIGETFMKTEDPGLALCKFIDECKKAGKR